MIPRRTALAGLAGLVATPARAAASRPVVLELFTSQGCSSCPPADALLRGLAAQPDVLALAFHVTYWDRLGWKDPFSLDLATARQRAYAPRVSGGQVYTPQLVVDGRLDAIGSDRAAVARALRQAGAEQPPGPEARLMATTREVALAIGAGTGTGRVLLAGFDRAHETRVGRGENAGETLREANIVRSFSELATWRGEPLTLTLPRPAGERFALLLQAASGEYLAAALETRAEG